MFGEALVSQRQGADKSSMRVPYRLFSLNGIIASRKIGILLTRRAFIGSAAAATAACGRRKASGFSGYAFIANQEGQAVAAVDLTVFAVARHIRVDGRPTAVIADDRRAAVYALTPENGTVHEIQADKLTFLRKTRLAERALSMRLAPDGGALYVLCSEPKKLVRVKLDSLTVDWQVALAAEPADMDPDPLGRWVAVSHGAARTITLLDLTGGTAAQTLRLTGDVGNVRFQSDGRQLIAANLSDRMLAIYQPSGGRLVVNLPLAVRPDHFCFNSNGGQLFVTGEGMDAVVVVYPYYTPQVAETVLAGHSPGFMAASTLKGTSPQFLFVANSKSGEVSILDVDGRRVVAVTPVGADPGYIMMTPDDRYALVLNQGSGDMAVIRVANIVRTIAQQRRSRKGAIFMMIPVGSKPVSGAVAAV
jgi:YVTN family beta-propeller protein